MAWPLIALAVLVGLIYYGGGAKFGRAQSQAWIDRSRTNPALNAWLNRHHGQFRAATHYIEFGGLYLIVYWIVDRIRTGGEWRFNIAATVGISLLSALAAYLDELHQLRSGGRQFRQIDFIHSCLGITIAATAVFLQAAARGTL